ncbi:iron ABC transporter permease [bacterium]|nr:MAG: iron ABC transporter permease [bacterium]
MDRVTGPGGGTWLQALPDGWIIITAIAALLVSLPLFAVAFTALQATGEIMKHIASTLLLRLLGNTAILVAGVGTGTLVLGVSLAWLTAACDYPGRKFFTWSLLLPMAVPAYVLAFTFLGLFDYSGPVQSFLRWMSLPALPSIRTPGGVVLVMSLALYPYVYLLSRNAFRTQGVRALEAASSLGHGHVGGFFKVALPMARPWIASGVMLVIMETLADFGAVSIFNFDTFTTAIYKAWFGFFSLPAAARLSIPLVLFAFIVLTLERRARARVAYSGMGHSQSQPGLIILKAPWNYLATGLCALVLSLAFVVPAGQLVIWAAGSFKAEFTASYTGLFTSTLALAVLSSAVICTIALVISYTGRRHPGRTVGHMTRSATLGYALPGSVLAVGVFMAVAGFDGFLDRIWMFFSGSSHGLYLQGTVVVLILAYAVRFMAVGYSSIDSSMHRVTRSTHESARTMGVSGLGLLRRVYLPILRSGVLTASILVFVDVMKEMPITLMTRPFGMSTLATKIFELTSEGEWERAALPAIVLIVAGLIPVAILTRLSDYGAASRNNARR